jgi:hypothetical protein
LIEIPPKKLDELVAAATSTSSKTLLDVGRHLADFQTLSEEKLDSAAAAG